MSLILIPSKLHYAQYDKITFYENLSRFLPKSINKHVKYILDSSFIFIHTLLLNVSEFVTPKCFILNLECILRLTSTIYYKLIPV